MPPNDLSRKRNDNVHVRGKFTGMPRFYGSFSTFEFRLRKNAVTNGVSQSENQILVNRTFLDRVTQWIYFRTRVSLDFTHFSQRYRADNILFCVNNEITRLHETMIV